MLLRGNVLAGGGLVAGDVPPVAVSGRRRLGSDFLTLVGNGPAPGTGDQSPRGLAVFALPVADGCAGDAELAGDPGFGLAGGDGFQGELAGGVAFGLFVGSCALQAPALGG